MICDYCVFKSECDYYETTLTPMITASCFPDTTFELKIREALGEFECEYFEEGEDD